jgi:hypothetical protein
MGFPKPKVAGSRPVVRSCRSPARVALLLVSSSPPAITIPPAAQGLAALTAILGGPPAGRAISRLRVPENSVQLCGRIGEMAIGSAGVC